MSIISKAFPWLFEEVKDSVSTAQWKERLERATPEQKRELVADTRTPTKALTLMARDPDRDIRTVLTARLAKILPTLSASEQVEMYDLTVGAIRALAEDQVTTVRVALATALKDVAKTPHAIARQLADDAERAVAEPILHYSLSLSDEDLLELIAQHPQDWHPVTIAQRSRLSSQIGDAIAHTDNVPAGNALLRNDGATISNEARKTFGRKAAYQKELQARDGLSRRLRQQWHGATNKLLHDFLQDTAHMDKNMTEKVLKKVHQHMGTQDNLKTKTPGQLDEEDITEALKLGENTIVIDALAARGRMPVNSVRRMADAGNGRAVIALCVKANMPMSFAVLMQSKLCRVPPAKMVYPKDGDKCPLTQEELVWQWEFFGIQ